MYDEDPMARDDLITVLMFDIANLTVGNKETKVFSINSEVKASRKNSTATLALMQLFLVRRRKVECFKIRPLKADSYFPRSRVCKGPLWYA